MYILLVVGHIIRITGGIYITLVVDQIVNRTTRVIYTYNLVVDRFVNSITWGIYIKPVIGRIVYRITGGIYFTLAVGNLNVMLKLYNYHREICHIVLNKRENADSLAVWVINAHTWT